jgi:hypothetical protein
MGMGWRQSQYHDEIMCLAMMQPTASCHYEFLQTAHCRLFLVNKNISVAFKGSKDSTIYVVEGNARAHMYVVMHIFIMGDRPYKVHSGFP